LTDSADAFWMKYV